MWDVGQTAPMSKEIDFHVEQDEDTLAAVCHEPEMATQGKNREELISMIRDLVRCRFDDGDERLRSPIRLPCGRNRAVTTQTRLKPATLSRAQPGIYHVSM